MQPINHVNAAVVPARITVVAVPQIWLQQDDGSIARAWAPPEAETITPDTTVVEVYVAADGQINGWWDAESGLAINQRHLDLAAPPALGRPAACQGQCGLIWCAPAPQQLAAHEEHCLTCNGALSIQE